MPPNVLGCGVQPLEPDEMWCVWYSPQTGTFEWICGVKAAENLLNGGMQRINGKSVRIEIVDYVPSLKGITVRATTTQGERIDVG